MYILAYLQNALKIRLENNVPMKKAERRSLLRCPLRHGSFPFHCLFTGRAYHFGSGLCFYNAALFHTIDKPTAPLNQSSGTSRRLLFRLFLPRDLEIHKAFLRFWSRGRQKVCPPIWPADFTSASRYWGPSVIHFSLHGLCGILQLFLHQPCASLCPHGKGANQAEERERVLQKNLSFFCKIV